MLNKKGSMWNPFSWFGFGKKENEIRASVQAQWEECLNPKGELKKIIDSLKKNCHDFSLTDSFNQKKTNYHTIEEITKRYRLFSEYKKNVITFVYDFPKTNTHYMILPVIDYQKEVPIFLLMLSRNKPAMIFHELPTLKEALEWANRHVPK
jgi:hypothetical protein